ncbi:MAG: substrate-binding domain-containing protein [Ruthenibacterium sp.]
MSAQKRTTLRDLAQVTGLSVVSVHKALHGKSGVSENTRCRVQAAAQRLHYSANDAASALKRGVRTLAVVLPAETEPYSYFYRDMWRAVRECAAELADFNVALLECPCVSTWHGQAAVLESLRRAGTAEGVVVANSMDRTALNSAIDLLAQSGVPVVTVNSDACGAQRLCCISPPNGRAGRLAAEFMAGGMPDAPCTVAVCGARETSDIHRKNMEGFAAELARLRPKARLTDVRSAADDALAAALRAPDLYGAYSPSARGTMQLCAVAEAVRLRGKCLVGSDAFAELVPYFESGVLRATVWKDPYGQMHRAIHALYEHLSGRAVADKEVRIGLVLRNNIIDYL